MVPKELHESHKKTRDDFMAGRAKLIDGKRKRLENGGADEPRQVKRSRVGQSRGYSLDVVEDNPFYYWKV